MNDSLSYKNKISKISFHSKLIGILFGAPDLRKAFGGFCKTFSKKSKKKTRIKKSLDKACIYYIDFKKRKYINKLPKIWLSECVTDTNDGSIQQRAFTTYYPNDADKGGRKALYLAEQYFAEGLNMRGVNVEELRIQCFQAAELLYMHAMAKGNIVACTRLGIIYKYDMCKGLYVKDVLLKTGKHAKGLSSNESAYKLFRKAASRGDIEAIVQLGEMLRNGLGCEKSMSLAFNLFKEAIKKSIDINFNEIESWVINNNNRKKLHLILASNLKNAVNIGNAALSIAEFFEQGFVVAQSFNMAKIWYEISYEALSVSFDYGFWYSKRNKNKARWGYLRALQEINGKY